MVILFQSTLPYGSELQATSLTSVAIISIHAPLRERPTICRTDHDKIHFNPRSLTGANSNSNFWFLVTLISIHAPLRERAFVRVAAHAGFFISIHAPLRERFQRLFFNRVKVDFNPRSLTGARLLIVFILLIFTISIHAPLRERAAVLSLPSTSGDFNPRSLAGATGSLSSSGHLSLISIHAPSRERLF